MPSHQRLAYEDFTRTWSAQAAALRTIGESASAAGIDKAIVELVKLRASQINGCAYCVDLHTRDLLQAGMSIDKVTLVPVWHEADEVFSARERAALRWTESLTRLEQTGAPDADYDAAAAVFEPRELADLTVTIALMNAYNRLGVGLRMAPQALTALRAKAR